MSQAVSSRQQTVIWIAIPNGKNPESGAYRVSVLAYPRLYFTPDTGSTTLGTFPDVAMWAARSQSVAFRLNFGGSIVGAKRVSRLPDIPFWTALFPDMLAVNAYPAPALIEDRRTLAYPLHHILTYLKAKYQEVGRQWPWEPPLAEALIHKFDDIARAIVPDEQAATIVTDVWNDFEDREWVNDFYHPDYEAGEWTQKEKDWLFTRLFFRPANVLDAASTNPKLEHFDAYPAGGEPPPAPDATGHEEPPTDNLPAPESPRPEFHSMLAAVGQYPELLRIFGLLVDVETSKPPRISTDPTKRWIQVLPTWSPNKKVKNTNVSPKTYYDDTTSFRARPRDNVTDPPQDPPPTFGVKDNPERIRAGYIDLTDSRNGVSQADVENALLQLQGLVEDLPYRAGERVTLPPLASGGLAATRESAAERWVEQNKMVNARVVSLGANPAGTELAKLDLFAEDLLVGYRLDIGSPPPVGQWHSLHQRQTTYYFMRKSQDDSVIMQDEGWLIPALNVVGDQKRFQNLFAFNTMSPAIGRWTGWSLSVPQQALPEGDATNPFLFSVTHAIVPGTLPMLRFGVTYHLRVRTVDSAGLGPAFDTTFDPAAPYISPEMVYRRFEPIPPPVVATWEDYDAAAGKWKNEPALSAGEAALRLVVRDNMPDAECERFIAPSLGTVAQSETHGLFDTASGLDPVLRDDALDREEAVVPAFVQQWPMLVNYLPDYLCRGAVFHGLPGASRPVKCDFGTTWPARQTFVLRLLGGTEAPFWNADSRVLTVYVAPSETVRVKLASYFEEEQDPKPNDPTPSLDLLGMWQWLKEGLETTPSQYQQLRQGALDGRHWLLTPSKEIVLVHAVQRPLVSPDFVTLGAKRALNDTSTTFSGVVKVHGKSTKNVAVAIQWTEPTDDLTADGPEWVGGVGHTFDTPVASQNATEQGMESKFDFRDTKYRRVQCRATATSRFADYFALGTPLSRNGVPEAVDVFNTARPLAPKVRYVVPTFGWEKPAGTGSITSIRWGGGLRVYLDRPWYSTGEGEMLAVVLAETPPLSGPVAAGRPVVDERLLPYVTQWGADPLWRARDTYPMPRPEHFRAARAMQTGLELVELAGETGDGLKVAVAGHDVQFDPARRLWYCDLEVDAGPAYFPFVRLALARYQPASVVGAHLSPVVVADYVQMAPNRVVHLTRGSDFVDVAVSGETYTAGFAGLAEMEASLEQQTGTVGSLGQWSPVAGNEYLVALKRDGPAWFGRVPVASGYSPGQYRVVIKEFEQLMSDTGVVRRLVYADAIVL